MVIKNNKIYSKVSNRFDEHTTEVVFGAIAAFSQKAMGSIFAFLMNIMLAKALGAKGLGIYYQAITVISIAATFSNMGIGTALIRYISVASSNYDCRQISSLYSKGINIVFLTSIIISLIVYSLSAFISNTLFNDPTLKSSLVLAVLAITPFTLSMVHSQLLQAIKKVGYFMFFQTTLLPALMVLLLFISHLYNHSLQPETAIEFYVVCSVITLMGSYFFWQYFVPTIKILKGSFPTKKLLSTSFPLFLVSSMYMINSWSDTIILGIFNSSKDVGIYNIALKVSLLVNFILVSFNSIISPKIAVLWANNKLLQLSQMVTTSTRIMMAVAIPIFIFILTFQEQILTFFGKEFLSGDIVLTILIIGQIINVSTGPAGQLLAMTGHQIILRNILFASAITNIILNFLLIPVYGKEGAALATAITIVLSSLMSVYMVKRNLGINSHIFGNKAT